MLLDVDDNDNQFNVDINQININDSITIKSLKHNVEKFRQLLLKNKSKIFSTSSSMRMKTYE